VIDEFEKIFHFDKYGSVNLEGFYTTGRQSRPQCDMSCMISPGMFREFVKPALIREAANVTAMVYHLDGPGALKHVDALCEVEGLDLITWVPGTGNEKTDWTWLYDKITGLGKGYGRYVAGHDEIKQICRTNGMLRNISFSTRAGTKTEAECFIADVEKMYG